MRPAAQETSPEGLSAGCGEAPILTILLPCRDEQDSVADCVREGFAGIRRSGLTGQVLVVDNASADHSARNAREAGAIVVHAATPGYGNAVRAGLLAARGRWIVLADADGSYSLTNLDGLLAPLHRGSQLVIGDRFAGGIEMHAMPPLHRYLGNPALSWIGRQLSGTAVRDMHCGLRAFHSQATRDLGLRSSGMELASEMIFKAAAAGHTIEQVPVELRPTVSGRQSHLRPMRDGLRHLRLMMLERRRRQP